jgi:hypothetical protein
MPLQTKESRRDQHGGKVVKGHHEPTYYQDLRSNGSRPGKPRVDSLRLDCTFRRMNEILLIKLGQETYDWSALKVATPCASITR